MIDPDLLPRLEGEDWRVEKATRMRAAALEEIDAQIAQAGDQSSGLLVGVLRAIRLEWSQATKAKFFTDLFPSGVPTARGVVVVVRNHRLYLAAQTQLTKAKQ